MGASLLAVAKYIYYISNYDVLKASILYNLERLAISKSSSYVSEWDLYMAINARSCILSTFLLSDDRLTKMPY